MKKMQKAVAQQAKREADLFQRVELLTQKLAEAQPVQVVQAGCPGASPALPDMPEAAKKRSGRCPLTDQVGAVGGGAGGEGEGEGQLRGAKA